MEHRTSLSNLGAVASVRGNVVDITFKECLPPIYSVLRAGIAAGLALILVGCASQQERTAFADLKIAETAPQQVGEHIYTPQELPALGENSTLNEYLAYAALNNADLEAAFYRWKAELERVQQVRTLPDPQFNYGFFAQPVETRVGPQEQRLGISQMFPWFGKLRLRGEAALEMADAAQQQYEHAKLMVFYRVKDAYYELYYLGRAVVVTTENRDLVQQFETVAKAKYESDTAMYADVIKAQTELDKLNDRLRTLQDFKGPILARLNAALNRPFNAPLPWPKATPIMHLDLDDQQLAAALVKDNPELRGLDSIAAKEKTGIALAKKEFFPDVRLGVDYTVTGEALNPATPGSGKDAVMVGVSINLPIWEGKYRAGVREAMARFQAALKQRIDRGNTLTSDLKLVLFKYQDASRKIALYRDALIPKADQTLKVTQRAFEAGKADFLSLIDAERVLLEFQLTYERALADHAQRLAELEMLLGRSLSAQLPKEHQP
jgi:cobalt-zinc-cadmium efflux system outer membrane protein